MRAIVVRGPSTTELIDLPEPEPGPGEIVLAIGTSGLCGTDLFKLAAERPPVGRVLGHEIVGRVSAIGPGTEGFGLGDRVVVPHHVSCGRCRLCLRGAETQCPLFKEDLLAPGGFAERVLVRQRAVERAARRLPAELADDDAVWLEPAACVLRGIDRSGVLANTADDREPRLAVIFGGGSMGLLHLLVLRAIEPSIRTIVADPRLERRQLAVRLGTHRAVEPGRKLAKAIRELSDGLGADAVFDTVGGRRLAAEAIVFLRPGGTAVLFAHAVAAEQADFELNRLFKEEKRLVGTYSGSLAEQRRIFDLLVAGALRPHPLVTDRLPLEEFAVGVERARAHQALKVVFAP